MDLTPTEEQRLLRESAGRFVRAQYNADARRKRAETGEGFSAATWREFADLGWLALPLPEAHGGLGGGAVEVGMLMEAFGEGLVDSPYVSTVILGAGAVAAAGSPAQQADLLPKVAEGALRIAFAHSERQARYNLADVATHAVKDADGWVIDGAKTAVLDADEADLLIVSARIHGNRADAKGIGLFLVPRDAEGVTLTTDPRLGGGMVSQISLAGVRLGADALLGGREDALPVIEAAIDHATAALCAEAVGMMQTLVETTAAYIKTREQFGKPLSVNQALRHRMADMAVAVEEGRSLALRAALFADAEPVIRARAVSGAKAKIGRGARYVAEQAVQLHGGMGVTEELEIGAFLKRVVFFDAMFGGADHHLKRHAALSAAGRAA
ncbi:acyl-CoA dehydrogenase family protein [Camelimonas sp. ID_303_24]